MTVSRWKENKPSSSPLIRGKGGNFLQTARDLGNFVNKKSGTFERKGPVHSSEIGKDPWSSVFASRSAWRQVRKCSSPNEAGTEPTGSTPRNGASPMALGEQIPSFLTPAARLVTVTGPVHSVHAAWLGTKCEGCEKMDGKPLVFLNQIFFVVKMS